MRLAVPSALLALALLPGCGDTEPAAQADAPKKGAAAAPAEAQLPTADEARAFARQADQQLRELWVAQSEAAWAYETDITDAHEAALVEVDQKVMAWLTENIPVAAKMAKAPGLDEDVKRQLELLTRATSLPAPADAAKRKQLAEISAKLSGMYGKGKHCTGEGEAQQCRDLGELSAAMAQAAGSKSGSWEDQLAAWEGWRTVSPPMKPMYENFVELGNEGAKAVGYDDVGVLWRSGYDMSPAEAEAETERLWNQVKPLYEQLHCHVRAKLAEKYGDDKITPGGLIPAHVTGNMWAQSWENLYPLMEPHPGQPDLDVAKKLKDWPAKKIVKAGEGFFTSMGMDPMPATFWERSMFEKPEDREVVCHASAWDVQLNDDQRIKMCIKPTLDDLVTIHHELGHNYYNHYYTTLPVLFQAGAHDGFHEGIGDTLVLSITPGYLNKIGLLDAVSESEEALLNKQMLDALSKLAFLPFGRMIDQWRWDVFSGKVPPEQWNEHWWTLRAKYQGIGAPVDRPADAFDPGAKYHIPANTPYLRYFYAHVLQFQFHDALCKASGHEGPLHTCSIYGSKEAGQKMSAMLAMGASKPWPDALEKVTGTRQMNAEPLMAYFSPLMGWLQEQNKDRQCGWQAG
jgi:peptidyl-dipeptidase A